MGDAFTGRDTAVVVNIKNGVTIPIVFEELLTHQYDGPSRDPESQAIEREILKRYALL